MRNFTQQILFFLITLEGAGVVCAQQVQPSVSIQHSTGTDLVGLIQFEEGWGSSAPMLAAYVDKNVGPMDSFSLLREVRETIDGGNTSVVAMLNSGLFLDQAKGDMTPIKAADDAYQAQLNRYFLSNVFSLSSRSWVEFSTSSSVQTVMTKASDNYRSVERYLGNFLDLRDEIGYLENLFNYNFDHYVVVPSFFFLPHSGSGLAIMHGNETFSYFVFGVLQDIDEGNEPGLKNSGFTRTSEISALAVHEFAHTFYGQRLRTAQAHRIQDFWKKCGRQLSSDFERLGYNNANGEGIFEEYFVRSLEVLFRQEFRGAAEADKLIEYEKSIGFLGIQKFVQGVKKSINNKDFIDVIYYIEREMQT